MRSIRRVLIVHPYGIGDLLFITPVLRALRLLPSVERVDVLLGSRTEAVLKNNPHVDDIFSVDKDQFRRQGRMETFRQIIGLGKRLRAKHYDLLLDYSLRGEHAFYAQFFLGIGRRAGFRYKKRGFFHNRGIDLRSGFDEKHMVDYCCDLAETAGVRVRDRWIEFYIKEDDRRTAKDLLARKLGEIPERMIAVSPGGGESWGRDAHFKRWPPAFFSALIQRLKPRLRFDGAVLLGGTAEKPLAQEIKNQVTVPCADFCGETALGQTVALIDESLLFLGNDGGLLHLASGRRKPIIGLYGPSDPRVYGPYPQRLDALAVVKEDLGCRPCYRGFRYRSDCEHRVCLQGLTCDDVMSGLETQRFFDAFSVKKEKAVRP